MTDLENNLVIKMIDKVDKLTDEIKELNKKIDSLKDVSNNHFNIDNAETKKDNEMMKGLGAKLLEKVIDRISDDKLNNIIDFALKFAK